MKGIWLQHPERGAHPCHPTCSLSEFFQMVNVLCLYGRTGAAECRPIAGCVPGRCAAQQFPAAPGWVSPYCVWTEAAPRARDLINQLLPQLTFPALKGIVLKRLDNVLSQLGCTFELVSFTWERKNTDKREADSKPLLPAGRRSQFILLQPSGSDRSGCCQCSAPWEGSEIPCTFPIW